MNWIQDSKLDYFILLSSLWIILLCLVPFVYSFLSNLQLFRTRIDFFSRCLSARREDFAYPLVVHLRLRSTFIFLIRISLSKTRNVMVWCSPEIQIFLVIYHSYSLLSIYFLLEQFPLTIGREAVLYKTQHQVRSRTRSIIICLVRLNSISVGGMLECWITADDILNCTRFYER